MEGRKEEIKVGDYFICKSVFNAGIVSTDIFAKVLAIYPESIYILRCTEFGFKQLSPIKVELDFFLSFYTKLSD